MQALMALQQLSVAGMPDNLDATDHLHMLNSMLSLSAIHQVHDSLSIRLMCVSTEVDMFILRMCMSTQR